MAGEAVLVLSALTDELNRGRGIFWLPLLGFPAFMGTLTISSVARDGAAIARLNALIARSLASPTRKPGAPLIARNRRGLMEGMHSPHKAPWIAYFCATLAASHSFWVISLKP
jgi:hypothetical protein